MSRLVLTLRVAALPLLLLLATCNSPPWRVSQSPDAITLRWYSDEIGIAAAQAVADRHCRYFGKIAELASDEQSGSVEVAEFRCL
jgi:starvation-inducible outer membrane lipoprotein